jgi:hypothetical protein
MADSMKDVSLKHTLKRCDEIRESYVHTRNNAFEDYEPHMIEIRTDEFTNDHVEEDHEAKLVDLQKYDIVKFIERKNGDIVSKKPVIFNVGRIEKDLLLSSVLKPKVIRQRGQYEESQQLQKKYRAVVRQ